ncbi:hypothetical protein ABC977_10715 [Thioalkalicoccus limnaeus]|uniref:Uncharacterized protein n=1 Tax=Thioalkalicoccus limnaeus TaxID=120681 RepID=A0ABV4BKC9_9GAMM
MGETLFLALVILAVLLIPIVVFGPIAMKAGFSRWWSLILIVPFANVIAIWIFAFIEWPAEQAAAASTGGEQPPRLDKVKIDASFWEFGQLLTALSEKDLSGPLLRPQLILGCKTAKMAKSLLEGFPASAEAFLEGETELFEFGDGAGAVRFPLKNGHDILQILGLLREGDYGDEALRITNGMAIRFPSAEHQALRATIKSEKLMGIGRLLEDEDFWWW